MPALLCVKVRFFSPGDEAVFFAFARGIKAVRGIDFVGDAIALHTAKRISDTSLRELLGFFERYRIRDMSQLAQFATDRNRPWFADPQRYWHKKVFAHTERPPA